MTGPRTGAAVVLPGEWTAAPGALEAWLPDPAARDVVAEASDVLGRDVVAWWGDPLNLHDPAVAHLAALVVGVAGCRSLASAGLQPVAVAGHGVGEYAALVAAGALRLDQVVDLVDCRAEMLAHGPRPSTAGMAAVVGPGAGEVAQAVVADLGTTSGLAIAAYDGPSQVVLSGWCPELAHAREVVVAAGLDLVRLPGRAAGHGPLVQSIADRLAPSFDELDWSVPDVPVLSNVDARPSRDPEHLARCLQEHLTSPVQWEATAHALVADAGATWVVEVGAVPTLGPLIRQVHPGLPVLLATGPGLPGPDPHAEHALTGAAPSRGER
ncbi:ACP S-malonyltransferase [Modestobacter sp. VKM Ac-2979]|uniref:ACP S-malonyltransferase n=1 Tax=unclassified Modestobacter TaxID=2643866 RepID=UPI0022ABAEA0|nr:MULTISPECIES: ACP S-malonyltransferase [unclassified Modestobacter]MCZ2810766.1 ACP S-malonyltransferase [Modestobacter sp. VKM Ac-2979]MCZ2840279.1 ACP S-malonyltransferase [Modestobacter sp. VKM Ac-2980]